MIVIFTARDHETPETVAYHSFQDYMDTLPDFELDSMVLYAWIEGGREITREHMQEWLAQAEKEHKEEVDNEKFESRKC